MADRYFVIYRENGVGESKLVPEHSEDMASARLVAEGVMKADPRRVAYILKAQEMVKTELSILFRTL